MVSYSGGAEQHGRRRTASDSTAPHSPRPSRSRPLSLSLPSAGHLHGVGDGADSLGAVRVGAGPGAGPVDGAGAGQGGRSGASQAGHAGGGHWGEGEGGAGLIEFSIRFKTFF